MPSTHFFSQVLFMIHGGLDGVMSAAQMRCLEPTLVVPNLITRLRAP